MGPEVFEKLAERYPFITLCTYAGNEYIGVIQNRDDIITTIYDFGTIQSAELKTLFLDLANVWWWESNRMIPINIFLKQDWKIFKHTLRTFNNKDVEIIAGHIVNLNSISEKRVKRRSIQLVKRVK